MLTKPALTDSPIHPLLRDRWSPRAFEPTPIPQEQILCLLEAARWSPSGGNGQPWSFLVIPRDDEEAFARAVSSLNEGNQVWAREAPLLIIAVAKLLRDNGAPNPYALYDLGQAVAHLSIQASAMGLVVHQIGGFSAERTRELFGIPEGYQPVTFSAVGPQGDHTLLPEALREREQLGRSRRPLTSFVFSGKWGTPSPLVVPQEVF